MSDSPLVSNGQIDHCRCIRNVSIHLIHARFRSSPSNTNCQLSGCKWGQAVPLAYPQIPPSDQTVGSSSLSERSGKTPGQISMTHGGPEVRFRKNRRPYLWVCTDARGWSASQPSSVCARPATRHALCRDRVVPLSGWRSLKAVRLRQQASTDTAQATCPDAIRIRFRRRWPSWLSSGLLRAHAAMFRSPSSPRNKSVAVCFR